MGRHSKARTARSRDKALQSRERIKQCALRFMERRQTRLTWWQQAFRTPMSGGRWLFSNARALWAAFLSMLGLAPPRRARLMARRSDIRGNAARKAVNRNRLFVEGLEHRKLLAADLGSAVDPSQVSHTANASSFDSSISADGARVALTNSASNLAAEDATSVSDVFRASATPSSLTATLSSGELTVTDIDGSGKLNNLTISLFNDGLNDFVEFTDASESFNSAPTTAPASTLTNGGKTLRVPNSALTNIAIDLSGGNDTLTIDLTTGDAVPSGGIDFSGGVGTDALVILGGSQGTVTYDYTNANDGSIEMSNYGTVTYAGLEPITNSGSVAEAIFNLPSAASEATLANDGLGLKLSAAAFEDTYVTNPSVSLTINRGNAADTLTIGPAASNLTSALTVGSDSDPFSAITVSGAVALGASQDLAFYAAHGIVINGDISADDITLDGDTGSQVSGSFVGIHITANVTATNNVLLQARGGDSGSNNVGVWVLGDGVVSGAGT
ncbi:MAG: hypothetical protein KDA51_03340, partial [Planctomycetales bacterium]|nr:hypothetical protein [Planctomycetales bacterium]